jgi:hypothetical protein
MEAAQFSKSLHYARCVDSGKASWIKGGDFDYPIPAMVELEKRICHCRNPGR